MKRIHLFSLILLFPTMGFSQNQAIVTDDIYFNPGIAKNADNTLNVNQMSKIRQSTNYKNGAKEIVFKNQKQTNTNQSIVHDTVYVVGQAGDVPHNNKNINQKVSIENGIPIIHDTIFVTEQLNESSPETDQNQGYYLNGFNGNQSDLDYAQRIRLFHNPRYSIFISDPRYNDIYFLNNNDWNVYIDGTYAYVTPTWTNPYWWNYNFMPYSGYGSWGYGFGSGWYSPFYSDWYNPYGYYDGFGYGYGYGYPYYGYGYGNFSGYGFNRYTEGNRRHSNNPSGNNRLGGTRTESEASRTIGGSSVTSGSRYTVVSGTRDAAASNGPTSSRAVTVSNFRSVNDQVNGIGIVRNSGTRTINNQITGRNSQTQLSNTTINTNPRTYSTTSSNVPNGTVISGQTFRSGSGSSYRGNSSVGSRSSSSGSSIISFPSRGNYSSESSSSVSRSNSPGFSTGSGSSNNISSGSSGGGRSSGSSSNSSSSSGGGRR